MGIELTERVEALEREAKRLRRWVALLGAILAACVTVAATDSPRDLILRSLTIVDSEGTPRIVAGTSDGASLLVHYDRDQKRRISAGTDAEGSAVIAVIDSDKNVTWAESSK